jgi:ABC-type multidrug transport system fused ATPase/permease subunit
MSTVHLFYKEESHKKKFRIVNENKVSEDLRSVYYNAVYLPSIDLFSALGMALIIWYGGGKFIQDQIQLGVLVAFLQYLQKFFEPIRDLAEKFNIIQTAIASAERTFELLDTPEDIVDPLPSCTVKQVRGEVEFRNVWFSYKKDEPVLQDISFSLLKGESLAVVGATGAGKTSIINALCHFYEISRGNILLDGVSIHEMNRADLRRQIALVQQDVFLFSGSILDNIRLGNSSLTSSQIEAIAKLVNLHPFIESLPGKYEEDIRERGSILSLGQKQLLSFARALAVNPKVLVLDEATSSIDTETERHVQNGIKEIIRGRTSIIIAHRLSTLKYVNKILVLKEGQIAEYGRQQDLIKAKGIYWKLYNLQAGIGDKL